MVTKSIALEPRDPSASLRRYRNTGAGPWRRYFPNSAQSPEKQLFLLKKLADFGKAVNAPEYPSRSDGKNPTGSPLEFALSEFLDTFYISSTADRIASVAEEPPLCGDANLDAYVAAIAEHLTKSYTLAPAPAWVEGPTRSLSLPWFTARDPDDGLKEYLSWSSPAAFKRRNIMTEGAPLRRATTPHANVDHAARLPTASASSEVTS